MTDPTLIRLIIMAAPMLVTLALWIWRKPDTRMLSAILLACLWQFPPLLVLNALAPHFGWWAFNATGGLYFGVPIDLLVAWMFLWGAIPVLAFPRQNPILIAAAAFVFDVIAIPFCRPVIDLFGRWLLGELLCIVVALIPGLILARWTLENRNLVGRALLQAVGFGGFFLGVIPATILVKNGGSLDAILSVSNPWLCVGVEAMALFAALGLSACQEFARRGGGTAYPYDGTKRLVISGPYAYLSNPMQVSTALVFITLGILFSCWQVVAGGAMIVVFSLGFANWHDSEILTARFGAPYTTWRRAVRSWIPRWRPWVVYEASLYYAKGCDPCDAVAKWLEKRPLIGLKLVPAQHHPTRDLSRMTYNPADGGPEEEGVAAMARALEHIHLGWAVIGGLMRLPGICSLLQVCVDVSGGGPRLVQRQFDQDETHN